MSISANEFRWLTAQPIAHRGLHDGNRKVPENSLSGFRAAIRHGFAIECDIQRSRDGVPIVFHDHTLARMAGIEADVADLTIGDLASLKLAGTEDSIPTLHDLLTLANGRVPLVIEIKGRDRGRDEGFMAGLRPLLSSYVGPIALMSFDDWILDQSSELALPIPIGLTAEGTRPDVLERHRVVFERNCSFVSYNVHHLPNPFVEWVRSERGAPVISWTVRTQSDVERSLAHADQMTFEDFLPPAS